ncbi:SDR family oxidoreductase [Thermomonospora cellulosilytica]|uniref:NAD(P)-dependent dehydrogenase (Short-subunit alcohol dehydrogenase family) n=1 Tax=Thermomonospora cellulosilytica TaxID=1411118 RepID=A0A7W3MV56_9ACTN|nr:SDR family oxidoreductase [Thermomonospora cellulosilytica]MBA9002433.1 NAD(P)-dependent dehydrogenase (short-subunit alcohol dehydrogenase family) [Thermomonospora cellulosilytica]
MARAGAAGQVVVVTGAARGLGALIARRLAARGATLALLGLEPEELAGVAESCGRDAGWWEVDVTDDEAMARAAAEVVERYGRVDVVVANAGIATGGPVQYSDPRTFAKVIEVNLLGSVATARAFVPALRESRGYFFQVASLAALCAAPMMAAYCASKSGVEAFAHCLRAELAPHGVGVGVGYLSWTDTDMVRGADENEVLREMRAGLPFPAGRTYPLEPTVDRLVDGIVRRRAHVYGQRWIPAMQLVRGFVPAVVTRHARRVMADFERRWLAAGAPSALVGAGGAAASSADSGKARE